MLHCSGCYFFTLTVDSRAACVNYTFFVTCNYLFEMMIVVYDVITKLTVERVIGEGRK